MYVLVTGCTGFVGFHTALALHRAGHRVRLGVRSAEKMRRVYDSFDMPLDDHAIGEIIHPEEVAQSLEGVDAVVHCAAMVNLESRMADVVRETNVNGTRNVIGQAVERGVRSIVYVSSLSALFDPGVKNLDEDSPLTHARDGYALSKKEADEYVRSLIEAGAPVAMTYPSGIIGPDDPGLSEANGAIAMLLNNRFIITEGGIQQIDVRDLAAIHLGLLERGSRGLYIAGGHHTSWQEFADSYRRVLGLPVKASRVPGSVLRGVGRLVDMFRPVLPIPSVISLEAMQYGTRFPVADDSKVRSVLNHSHRPLDETIADTVLWLADKGHIDRQWVRLLAAPAAGLSQERN